MYYEEEMEKIINMTDSEAADFLEKFVLSWIGGRCNGRVFWSLRYKAALCRAIKKLREAENE